MKLNLNFLAHLLNRICQYEFIHTLYQLNQRFSLLILVRWDLPIVWSIISEVNVPNTPPQFLKFLQQPNINLM